MRLFYEKCGLAAENVGDRTEIGPNGERHGEGGALAFLEVTALTERKTFFTAMARLLPITIKTGPPLKKVLLGAPWCWEAASCHAPIIAMRGDLATFRPTRAAGREDRHRPLLGAPG
jgi:hypothetical protein